MTTDDCPLRSNHFLLVQTLSNGDWRPGRLTTLIPLEVRHLLYQVALRGRLDPAQVFMSRALRAKCGARELRRVWALQTAWNIVVEGSRHGSLSLTFDTPGVRAYSAAVLAEMPRRYGSPGARVEAFSRMLFHTDAITGDFESHLIALTYGESVPIKRASMAYSALDYYLDAGL